MTGIDFLFQVNLVNPVEINGVDYTWPSANAAGLLVNNGSGTVGWNNSPSITGLTTSGNITVNGRVITTGVDTFPASNVSGLTITSSAPPTVATANGTDSALSIDATGAAGQSTSGVSNNTGGVGGVIKFVGGAGGASTGVTGANHGGQGGYHLLTGGVGGASASTTGFGGAGGGVFITTGDGGAASAVTGANLGGSGGNATFNGGTGGVSASTAGGGGTGGSLFMTGGVGGNATAVTGTGVAGRGGSTALAGGQGGFVSAAGATPGNGGNVYAYGGAPGLGGLGTAIYGSTVLAHDGSGAKGGVAIRIGTAAAALHTKQIANTNAGGLRLERSDASNRWDNYIDGSDNLIWFFNGTSTGFYANSSGQLVAVGRIFSGAGFNGILGSDLAASPARGNKLQWNDANSAMEWATGSNVSNFSCILGSNQVHSSPSTFVKANLSAAQFDGLSEFDSTNHRLVIKRAGVYVFFTSMYANGPAANTRLIMSVFVNGSERLRLFDWTTGIVTDYIPSAGGITTLAASDVVELYLFQTAASTTFVANYTKLDGYRIA